MTVQEAKEKLGKLVFTGVDEKGSYVGFTYQGKVAKAFRDHTPRACHDCAELLKTVVACYLVEAQLAAEDLVKRVEQKKSWIPQFRDVGELAT